MHDDDKSNDKSNNYNAYHDRNNNDRRNEDVIKFDDNTDNNLKAGS